MADSIHDQIEQERKRALPEAHLIRRFRAYARGRHRGTLTSGQQRILRGLMGNLFCDNVTKRVLSELRNRLRLTRFEVAGDTETSNQIGNYLKDLWVLNGLAAKSTAVHWAMFRDGNTAASLNWIDGRVVISRERWWNGTSGMFVSYDDNDKVLYAVRDWKTERGMRRTIYYPDKIERYLQDGDGWKLTRLPTDPEGQGALPWRDAQGNPLGVPVVHFANVQVPNDADTDGGDEEADAHYGMSELDGGMLGLQDEINDVHRDLTAGGRFAGYQMLYGTGITTQDAQGNEIQLKVEPGAFFTDEKPDAKFGAIEAGSLQELERLLGVKIGAVSRMSGVPNHLIAGDWPSGEALLRAEMPLVDKIETAGASTGAAWASLAHKATVLSNAFGGTNLDTDLMITAVFAPADRRDPLTLSDIATKQAPFVSKREVLRILGKSPEEQDRILEELRTEDVIPTEDQ